MIQFSNKLINKLLDENPKLQYVYHFKNTTNICLIMQSIFCSVLWCDWQSIFRTFFSKKKEFFVVFLLNSFIIIENIVKISNISKRYHIFHLNPVNTDLSFFAYMTLHVFRLLLSAAVCNQPQIEKRTNYHAQLKFSQLKLR